MTWLAGESYQAAHPSRRTGGVFPRARRATRSGGEIMTGLEFQSEIVRSSSQWRFKVGMIVEVVNHIQQLAAYEQLCQFARTSGEILFELVLDAAGDGWHQQGN